MKNHKLFLWIGIILFVLPFLGIRQSLKNILLFIAGAMLIGTALVIRHQVRVALRGESERVFMENTNVSEGVFVPEESTVTEDEPAYEETSDHLIHDDSTVSHSSESDFSEAVAQIEHPQYALDTNEEVLPPVKKPRKKRTTKKPTVQSEMDEPVVMSEEVAQIVEDIDYTLDANKS